jgi:hypothetical protein
MDHCPYSPYVAAIDIRSLIDDDAGYDLPIASGLKPRLRGVVRETIGFEDASKILPYSDVAVLVYVR